VFVAGLARSDTVQKTVERIALVCIGILLLSSPALVYSVRWRMVFPASLAVFAGIFFVGGVWRVRRDLRYWLAEECEVHASTCRKLGKYYLDVESDGQAARDRGSVIWELDEEGIPVTEVRAQGTCHHPVAICQRALILFNVLCESGDQAYRKSFLRSADWLCDHLTRRGSFGVWEYRFRLAYMRPPWISAMAQGEGISVLLRAFQLTGVDRYWKAAELAMGAFCHDVSGGGVTFQNGDGDVVLEEYPASPAPHVLNGWIFAAWGILDFFRATGDREAYELYQRTMSTLKRRLPRYDAGYWSHYDDPSFGYSGPASPKYHVLHILQLEVLHALTGECVFRERALKWREYASRWSGRLRYLVDYHKHSIRRKLFR